jgi:hypothetical protein
LKKKKLVGREIVSSIRWENKTALAFLFKKKKKKKKKKIPIFTPTFFSFSPGGRTVFFFHGRLRLVITQGKYGREK